MRTGDIDWEEVYDAFIPRIFHFFCYKVGDPLTAEELTSATFEKAWASRRNFRKDRGQIQGWLLGIARHVAGDHFRKPSREVALGEGFDIPADYSVDEDLQRRLDYQKVTKILSTFPERQRELVALKYGAELTNREIASITRLSESNVGTILHRVLGRIRNEWEQDRE